MSRPEVELDCRSCGVCCISFYDQAAFCDLIESDLKRLSREFIKKNVMAGHELTMSEVVAYQQLQGAPLFGAIKTKWLWVKTGPLKGYQLNTCRALRGSPMNRVCCSIYKNRPSVCKIAVKPGDSACLEIREAFKELIERLRNAEDAA